MARTASEKSAKAAKPQIADINWAADNSSMVWALLAQIEKNENYRVLFGKKDASENTSGEKKVSVYNRIAQSILPGLFAINPNTVRDRVKNKLDSLTKMYKKHATRLHQTGEGVTEDDGSSEKTLSFYIMGDGPCVETPAHAVNIWKEIEKEFPFFPVLHCIFVSRPNVTPIVVTTALGPQGSKTVWYQPPDDSDNSNIDPVLLNEGVVSPTPHRERSFGNDANALVNANSQGPAASQGVGGNDSITPAKTSGFLRGPKPSSVSRDAIENTHKPMPKLPQRCSLADTLVEIQRENISAMKSQNRSCINLELRKQIIDELRIGLWTREQAQEKIEALENDHSPRPTKCQKVAVHEFSPDWESFPGSDDSQTS